MRGLRRFAPWLFLALVSAVPLWRAILLGQAIGPFDQIRHMAPWNGPAPSQPWDVLPADGVIQFFPWRDLVFDAWGKGQLPLWNPYQLAGTPLLANSQSAGFYPPHILAGLLHLPTAPAMTLLAWFHLLWAGMGISFLVRRLGGSKIAGAVGGASFLLTPFMLDWAMLPSVISTVAWIPWMLGFVVTLASPQNEPPPLRKTLVGLALCSGMMVLAGHLQFVAYGFLACFVVAVSLPFLRADRQTAGPAKPIRAGACLLGLGLGLLLSAIQLLPVLSYSQFSHRKNTPTDDGYTTFVSSAIQKFEMANLVVATSLGNPRDVLQKTDEMTLSTYWPPHVKQGENFAEAALTIGPLVVGLLFAAPWKDRRTWPFALIAVVSLLLAFGTPLNRLLYFFVPGWSSTGSPGRIIVLFLMSACTLGALGVDRLAEAPKKLRLGVYGGPVLLGLLTVLLLPRLSPDPLRGREDIVTAAQGAATTAAMPLLVIGLVLAALGVSVVMFDQFKKYRLAILAVPVLIAWTGYASDIVMTGEALPTAKTSMDQERAAFVNDNWPIVAQTPAAIYPPNTPSLTRIHDIAGYDSLLHRDTVAMLAGIDGGDAAPPENGNMMFVKSTLQPKALADAGVSDVYSLHEIPSLGVGDRSNGFFLYHLPHGARVTALGGDAHIEEDGYDHQTIAVSPGVQKVDVKDRWMPGWTVVGGGTVQASGLWRTISVPAGASKVTLTYSPPGLRTGAVLSLSAFLLCLVVYFIGPMPRRQAPEGA